MAHPDVVQIGKREADARFDLGPILFHLSGFPASVASGLLDLMEKSGVRMGGESTHGVVAVYHNSGHGAFVGALGRLLPAKGLTGRNRSSSLCQPIDN